MSTLQVSSHITESNVRTGVTILFIMGSYIANAPLEDDMAQNQSVTDLISIAGLIVLSGYMNYFKAISMTANVFSTIAYFSVVMTVINITMLNNVNLQQATAAVSLGLMVSYGLFNRDGMGRAAIVSPILIFIGLALSGSENKAMQALATFMIIDGFLHVIREWSIGPETPFIFIVFCGALEILSKDL